MAGIGERALNDRALIGTVTAAHPACEMRAAPMGRSTFAARSAACGFGVGAAGGAMLATGLSALGFFLGLGPAIDFAVGVILGFLIVALADLVVTMVTAAARSAPRPTMPAAMRRAGAVFVGAANARRASSGAARSGPPF